MKKLLIALTTLLVGCGFSQTTESITHSNRGLSKHDFGDYNGAILDYNKAIALDPNLAVAYNNRGLSKYKLEEGITFDGVDIKATFFTPYLPISDPTIRKTLYIAHTYLDPDGSFNAEMSLNYDFDSAIRADPIVLSNEISSCNKRSKS